MPKALIAGGAGFIGSHLSHRLIEKGFKVYCVDNLVTGSKNNIVNLLDNPDFMFFNHDVASPIKVIEERLEDVDYVFHLASPASPNPNSLRSFINLPLETMGANSVGTNNLLGLAQRKGSRFLFTSTSEVYGNPNVSPQNEDYFGNVSPNGTRSVYDEAKRFGEAMTFAYLRKFDLDARIIRIFNTYGPNMQRDDGRAVSNFINQALEGMPITIYGDGSYTRSFCYVDDMVEGIMAAMFTANTKGVVVNLGNPDERTIKETAELIKSLSGSKSEIVYQEKTPDDPERRRPDIGRAKSLLKWEPKITFEEGLKKTIDYFRNLS